MKLAILGESSADEAALHAVVEGLLDGHVELSDLPPLRSRGWPSVRDVLPSVMKHLHYHSDADALVVVVDSNSSPPHASAHGATPEEQCRFCQLEAVTEGTKRQLRPVGEAAWLLESRSASHFKNELKRSVYGTERPSLDHERDQAVAEIRRLVDGGFLPTLEAAFPGGFGELAHEVRRWGAL